MLNRWQRTIVDLRGNVVPYAQLQVRVEATQAAAEIYKDSAGTEVIPNGIVTANAQGYAFFYAPAGLYRITSAEPVIDWRDVNIGSAEALLRSNNLDDLSSASDARSNLGLGTAATRDVGTGANAVPANSNLGAAAYLPVATTSQAQELTNDATVITPKKLADAFAGPNGDMSATSGYQILPGEQGKRLMIQWGGTPATHNARVTFPIAFASGVTPRVTFGPAYTTDAVPTRSVGYTSLDSTGFNYLTSGGSSAYLVIGRA